MIGEQQENAEELHAVNPMIVNRFVVEEHFSAERFRRPDL